MFNQFSSVERVFGNTTIIVDEVGSKNFLYHFKGGDPEWKFPSNEIAKGISLIIQRDYPDLAIYLLRITFDTGGGDELSMKLYIYAKASDEHKIAHKPGIYPLHYYVAQDTFSNEIVFEFIKHELGLLRYRVQLYEETGIVAEEDCSLDPYTIHLLKQIGVKELLADQRKKYKY